MHMFNFALMIWTSKFPLTFVHDGLLIPRPPAVQRPRNGRLHPNYFEEVLEIAIDVDRFRDLMQSLRSAWLPDSFPGLVEIVQANRPLLISA